MMSIERFKDLPAGKRPRAVIRSHRSKLIDPFRVSVDECHASASARRWGLVGILVLGGMAAHGAAKSGSPDPEQPPELEQTVLGIARPSDADLLLLGNGDRLTGTVLNETVGLRTAYGDLQFAAKAVAGVQLATGTQPLDMVITVNDDRFSGFLNDRQFRFQLQTGSEIAVRTEKLLKVIFRRWPAEGEGRSGSHLVTLKNGDSFRGRLAGGPFELATAYAKVTLDLERLESIAFPEEQPGLCQVRWRNGDTLQGQWPAEDIRFEVDLGPVVEIYAQRIEAIYWNGSTGALRSGTSNAPASFLESSGSRSSRAPSVRPPADMVWIPPGEFILGSPLEEKERDLDEGPETKVTLTRGFWIGRCEVTQAEYKEVMGTNPSQFTGDPRHPVEKVSWREATDYCARLTRLRQADGSLPAGQGYRLPTEAEWEYAARAGTTTRFSHGDDPEERELGEYAWFNANSDSSTHPVGTRKPNPWGLHDLHGNVLEWCLDEGAAAYPGGAVTNHQAAAGGSLRVARGGSWLYGAKACRSANRDTYGEANRCSDLGFRVVLAPLGE